jgi:hypothetical protein
MVRQPTRRATRLDLVAIEASLRRVQAEFPRLRPHLRVDRDAMDDEVVENMLSGYALLDELISFGTELFEFGHLKHLVELNARVLYGTDETRRREYACALEANQRRFCGGGRRASRDSWSGIPTIGTTRPGPGPPESISGF